MEFHGIGAIAAQGQYLFSVFARHLFLRKIVAQLIRASGHFPNFVVITDRVPSAKRTSAFFQKRSCNEEKKGGKLSTLNLERIGACILLTHMNCTGTNMLLYSCLAFP